MLVLSVHTAQKGLGAAVLRGGEILADGFEPMGRGQDARLPGFVDELLTQAGCALSDIQRLAVVTGPGSFTGIRIGVAYMRGLSLVLEIPCVGVTSLEASVPAGIGGASLAAMSAQKRPPDQTWWVQGLEGDTGIAEPIEVKLEDLAAMLAGFNIPVFMDGSDALASQMDGAAFGAVDIRPLLPSAITAGLKAQTMDCASHPPSPTYARAPDAKLPALKP